MKKIVKKLFYQILCLCLFVSILSLFACNNSTQSAQHELQGYHAATFGFNSFFAVGSDGKLDRIENDKKINHIQTPTNEELLSIWTDNTMIIVGGAKGTLLCSTDGVTFSLVKTGISGSIFDITAFQGSYYACSEKGLLIRSQDGNQWESVMLETNHDLIAIAANSHYIMAITAESDIFISQDGEQWKWENFNTSYSNDYVPYVFTGLRNMETSFFIYGQEKDEPGSPFVMFSESGTVWTFKPFHEINGSESAEFMPLTIRAIGHNLDQVLAACDQGRLLTITECSTCHQITDLGKSDLTAIAYGNGHLLVAGTNFTYDVVDDSIFRQYNIKAEQAYENFQSGRAVLIDVRTIEEYEERHISGSLHIPVDEIATKLIENVPDQQTQLIFYCKAGTRSAQALETALELGYSYVYNLGGIDEWPYDIQTGTNP